MIVYRHGNRHPIHITCPKCNCEYSFIGAEARFETMAIEWKKSYSGYMIRCPECNEINWLSEAITKEIICGNYKTWE